MGTTRLFAHVPITFSSNISLICVKSCTVIRDLRLLLEGEGTADLTIAILCCVSGTSIARIL